MRGWKFGDWSTDSGLCLTGGRRKRRSDVLEEGEEESGLEGKKRAEATESENKIRDLFE